MDDSYEYPLYRQMRAAVKEQAELIAVSYTSRGDLTFGSDQETEQRLYTKCIGFHVRLLRAPARRWEDYSP